MKRFLALLLSLCMLACACVLAVADDAPFVGVWIETEGYGTLTIRLDGSATMVYYDGSVMDTTWHLADDGYRFGDGMWYNSPMALLDENTLSVSNGWMIFAREGFLPTTDEALLLNAEPVGEEGLPFFGKWELTELIMEGESLAPALFGISMSMTFREDGTCVSDDGEEAYTTTWFVSYGNAVVDGDIMTIDEMGRMVYQDMDGQMIFLKAAEETPEETPAETDIVAAPAPVGEDAEAFLGLWTLTSVDMDGMTLDSALFGIDMKVTFNADGTAEVEDGEEITSGAWTAADGGVRMDDIFLTLNELDQLIMEEDDARMIFTRGEAVTDSEASDAELLALLLMLAQMETEGEELSLLPENHQPFVGEWYLCYVATGGLTGDLRSLGVTGMLTLNADYTGILSGIADEEATWYEDEDGVIRFGEDGMPMFLIAEDEEETSFFLQYGTELGGYMIFHQDEEAVWVPSQYPLAGAAPVDTEPAAVISGGALLTDVKYVCTTYTTAGFTMDAATLGMAYEITFNANGTADFVMAGTPLPGLSYTADVVYTIDYYGNPLVCTPTDAGFDMDYFGAMTMHFVPAE